MKKAISLVCITAGIMLSSFTLPPAKLVSKESHIRFFSHTPVEDITADNYKATTTLDTETGDLVFSVPMQSFEFEKALMQKHYNSKDFLDTKQFPKAKFVGKISNMGSLDLGQDGVYTADVAGEMTIKEISKPITTKATLFVSGGQITLDSKMNLTLAEFGITFSKGKPSTNIAKEIEVTVKAIYAK